MIKNKSFKKNIVLAIICLLTVSLIISLTACASNSKSNVISSAKEHDQNYPAEYNYVKDFEQMGLGMFVHFGLYSTIGKGEWYLNKNPEANMAEYENLTDTFEVDSNWAQELVQTAKSAGAKYITITTRHHDGFSLYDTKGLNNYDAPHSKCGRDLIKEFVDACNANGIKPFFYHTLLDWHEKTYKSDFNTYLDYLYKSVELLCTNYGKIGGFWFDGSWDQPDADWKYDRLYNMIKSHQPEAMIINNTGLDEQGKVSSPLVDSVTYERGNPSFANNTDRPRAGEMCESLTDHWGYAQDDISFKPVSKLIDILLECRKFDCNLLINVGPKGNGLIGEFEKTTLENLGKWIRFNKNFIYKIRNSEMQAENAEIVKDENHYYVMLRDVPMQENVTEKNNNILKTVKIKTDKKVVNATYLDTDESVEIDNNSFKVKPFAYGTSLYSRIVQFDLE